MVQRTENFKPLVSANVRPRPSVSFPDGRRFFSIRDLAGYFCVNHADFLALLRRWREWLPASLRDLIDFESADSAFVAGEVLCG